MKFLNFGILVSAFLFIASLANAQTGLSFSAGDAAVALHYHGNWYAGTVVSEKLDVKDSAADTNGYVNSFYALGEEKVFSSTSGFNYFGGGFELVPTKTLAAFLKNTNIPADSFRVYASGTVGNVIQTIGSSYLSGSVNAGASYALNQNGTIVWNTVQGGWQNPGIFYVSTGLQAIWGGSATTQSAKEAKLRRQAAKFNKDTEKELNK